MAIYIKSMRMPENGLYQIVDGIIRMYDYRKIINDKEKDIQSYGIVEVPEPHGRLIDADRLKQWFFRPYSNEESYFNLDVAKAIDHAPTVIEGEVMTMTKNDIVREIDEWIQMATDNETDMAIKEFLLFLKERIESLPSAEAEWIPCSKRLPDTNVPVLVSDGVYVWEDELQEDYEDGKTMYWWDSQCSFDFNDTAWMPRPKPYKKDGDGE